MAGECAGLVYVYLYGGLHWQGNVQVLCMFTCMVVCIDRGMCRSCLCLPVWWSVLAGECAGLVYVYLYGGLYWQGNVQALCMFTCMVVCIGRGMCRLVYVYLYGGLYWQGNVQALCMFTCMVVCIGRGMCRSCVCLAQIYV